MSVQRLIYLLTFLAGAASGAWAQGEASLIGTVMDQSNAVQPNATVTAVETSSGRQYSSVTDERGSYRFLNMQPGTYRVRASQSGFAPAVANSVELLVGQTVTLPFALKLASVQQAVEVSAEAPLLNTQTQDIGGNIDRRQMDQLPLLGRNWLDLSMLVKGVTANDVAGNRPGVARDDQFQLNLDGQQITQELSTSSGFGQPRISRDAISEYQLVTSQFDIAQGRSVGSQVQAVTRSGTNSIHGTFYGNFRRDALNASDFVAHQVLPYSDSQLGGSFGGPIIKDKLHYFGAYEHESEPNTVFVSPQIYAGQGISLPTVNRQYSILARGDYTAGPRDQIAVRGVFWNFTNPAAGLSAQSYPASAQKTHRYADFVTGSWSRVWNGNVVSELRAGYYKYFFKIGMADGVAATPWYIFPGLTVGPGFNYPEDFYQRHPQVTYHLNVHHGSHDFKTGFDILERQDGRYWPLSARGSVSFSSAPPDLAARFPLAAWNNAAAWNFTGLDPLVTTVSQSFYKDPNITTPRPTYGFWLGDTWRLSSRLTLNLGIRWDADLGQYDPPLLHTTQVLVSNGFDYPNLDAGYHAGIRALNDWAPRFGFSYAAPRGWVIRGGVGMFYGVNETQLALGPETANGGQTLLSSTFINDGQPGFLANWTRGVTAADYFSGKVAIPPQSLTTIAPNIDDPRTLQATGGFQKQFGGSVSVDSDFVFFKGTHLTNGRDVNQFLDPQGSGYPLNPNPPKALNPSGAVIRPVPTYQSITYTESNLISEYMAIASSITKRFSERWQAGLTDTIMIKNNDEGSGGLPSQGFSEIANVGNPFCTVCEWARGASFQRNTLRFNGVYQAPWGIDLSSIVYIGTGTYYNSSYSAPQGRLSLSSGQFADNRLITGPAVTIPAGVQDRFNGPAVLPSGSQVPRDSLKGLPLYKVDMRVSKDFPSRERGLKFTAMVEAFNVFNHPNYGSYQTVVNLPGFGNPTQNTSISYVPREIQFAFRAAF